MRHVKEVHNKLRKKKCRICKELVYESTFGKHMDMHAGYDKGLRMRGLPC